MNLSESVLNAKIVGVWKNDGARGQVGPFLVGKIEFDSW